MSRDTFENETNMILHGIGESLERIASKLEEATHSPSPNNKRGAICSASPCSYCLFDSGHCSNCFNYGMFKGRKLTPVL